jgi:hypothetical protein
LKEGYDAARHASIGHKLTVHVVLFGDCA